VDIKDPLATIDGGDVLFTGREFFVGLSKTTNMAGAKAVASAFPEYPVTLLRVLSSFFCSIRVNRNFSGKERLAFEKFYLNGCYGYNGYWWI
jgi:arginine deiminase